MLYILNIRRKLLIGWLGDCMADFEETIGAKKWLLKTVQLMYKNVRSRLR